MQNFRILQANPRLTIGHLAFHIPLIRAFSCQAGVTAFTPAVWPLVHRQGHRYVDPLPFPAIHDAEPPTNARGLR